MFFFQDQITSNLRFSDAKTKNHENTQFSHFILFICSFNHDPEIAFRLFVS